MRLLFVHVFAPFWLLRLFSGFLISRKLYDDLAAGDLRPFFRPTTFKSVAGCRDERVELIRRVAAASYTATFEPQFAALLNSVAPRP